MSEIRVDKVKERLTEMVREKLPLSRDAVIKFNKYRVGDANLWSLRITDGGINQITISNYPSDADERDIIQKTREVLRDEEALQELLNDLKERDEYTYHALFRSDDEDGDASKTGDDPLELDGGITNGSSELEQAQDLSSRLDPGMTEARDPDLDPLVAWTEPDLNSYTYFLDKMIDVADCFRRGDVPLGIKKLVDLIVEVAEHEGERIENKLANDPRMEGLIQAKLSSLPADHYIHLKGGTLS